MRSISLAAVAISIFLIRPPADGQSAQNPNVELEALKRKLQEIEKTHKAELAAKDRRIKELSEKLKHESKFYGELFKIIQDGANETLEAANVRWKETTKVFKLNDQLRQEITAMRERLEDSEAKVEKLQNLLKKRDLEPNPPRGDVKGVIEQVKDAKDGTLVQISLGIKHGVDRFHTLEVYRMQPRPKHLGRLRIVISEDAKSFGRLIPGSGSGAPLKEGDVVVSKLMQP